MGFIFAIITGIVRLSIDGIALTLNSISGVLVLWK